MVRNRGSCLNWTLPFLSEPYIFLWPPPPSITSLEQRRQWVSPGPYCLSTMHFFCFLRASPSQLIYLIRVQGYSIRTHLCSSLLGPHGHDHPGDSFLLLSFDKTVIEWPSTQGFPLILWNVDSLNLLSNNHALFLTSFLYKSLLSSSWTSFQIKSHTLVQLSLLYFLISSFMINFLNGICLLEVAFIRPFQYRYKA